MHRYTPRDGDTGDRMEMQLSGEDYARVMAHGRRLGFKGFVIDQTTGKRYRIYGASCSLEHCYCDARAYEEPGA